MKPRQSHPVPVLQLSERSRSLQPGTRALQCRTLVLNAPALPVQWSRALTGIRRREKPTSCKPRRQGMTHLLRSSLACAGVFAMCPAAPAADQALVQKGASLYQLRCEGCHGEALRNTSGGWSFDLRRLRPDEHDRFVESVTSGKDNMPSWYGVLTPDDIEAIWSYIRAAVDK